MITESWSRELDVFGGPGLLFVRIVLCVPGH
jgi:hypothetical protein